MKKEKISIFWFRRDLRIKDNNGFLNALLGKEKVLPIFIFDINILKNLNKDDARVSFISSRIKKLKKIFLSKNSDILVLKGDPEKVFEELLEKYNVVNIYTNNDYEPYAKKRDIKIKELIEKKEGNFFTFKDQVIFEKKEIIKSDFTPYTVFTPYLKKWKQTLYSKPIKILKSENYLENLVYIKNATPLISLEDIGFEKSEIFIPNNKYNSSIIKNYGKNRNILSINGTSKLSIHLRFGTISIRELVKVSLLESSVFLNELIWREFFMQILYNFPKVTKYAFREKYKNIKWKNNKSDFEKWKSGKTGYPLVDAGMRELNKTGYMHNRVRMLTASFLCKHLLIDWRWGEEYFAKKLLDFDLASNNGGWQWCSGTGCDASPYFRGFNPEVQQKKFDPEFKYIKKWIPEFNTVNYPKPIIEHSFARNRAIERYKEV